MPILISYASISDENHNFFWKPDTFNFDLYILSKRLFLPLQSIKFCLVFVSRRQMCAKFRISNFVSRLPTPWTPSWRRLMERWQQVWRCKRKLLEHYGPILLTIYLGQPFLGEESLIIKVVNNEATFIK